MSTAEEFHPSEELLIVDPKHPWETGFPSGGREKVFVDPVLQRQLELLDLVESLFPPWVLEVDKALDDKRVSGFVRGIVKDVVQQTLKFFELTLEPNSKSVQMKSLKDDLLEKVQMLTGSQKIKERDELYGFVCFLRERKIIS